MITFCHAKQLTPISKRLNGQVFHVLLTNEHSVTCNQNNCSAFFFATYIKAAIQVLCFKVCQYIKASAHLISW